MQKKNWKIRRKAMLNVIIENATRLDTEDIMQISRQCFSYPWTRKSIENEFDNNPAFYLVAKVNGKAVGFGGFWLIFDEAHITNIAVLPEYRKLGIGSILLKAMFDKAKSKDATSMTLEVRRSNSKALGLYSKFNFVKEGVRPNYYNEPKEDAIIMWNRSI